MALPKHLQVKSTTRSRSKKQESRIARDLKGLTTINSGATFGQNDVITDFAEIEAKTTTKNSYSLKVSEWEKLQDKANNFKIPIFVISFETLNKDLAVLSYEDLKYLIKKANE